MPRRSPPPCPPATSLAPVRDRGTPSGRSAKQSPRSDEPSAPRAPGCFRIQRRAPLTGSAKYRSVPRSCLPGCSKPPSFAEYRCPQPPARNSAPQSPPRARRRSEPQAEPRKTRADRGPPPVAKASRTDGGLSGGTPRP